MIPADLVTQTEEIFDQKLFFFAVISVITVLSFILESMKLIPFYVIYGPENWFFGECITDNNMKFYQVTHCVKYVRIRSFSGPYFRISAEYGPEKLWMQTLFKQWQTQYFQQKTQTYLFTKCLDEHNISQCIWCSKEDSIQHNKNHHSTELMQHG